MIVRAEVELDHLSKLFDRWRAGELNNATMFDLVQRSARKLNQTCRCDDQRCCTVHEEHVSPHQGCVLR